MRGQKSKLHNSINGSLSVRENERRLRIESSRRTRSSGLPTVLVAVLALLLLATGARAQAGPTPSPSPTPTPIANPCPPAMIGQTLVPVPEIVRTDGKLRGTVILSDEQEWMAFRVPVSAPSDSSRSQCLPQYVRTFRELGATPTMASAPSGPFASGAYATPRPGPTLRARVGDLIQLTFLNQINPANFGNSIDRGEIGACDETSVGYPGKPPGGDTFPDCFHGSSTGNIHFHGTHTNPNSTGDNVFIEVRPSPREDNKPTVTPESVQKHFDRFFAQCEERLSRNVLDQWPRKWDDLPDSYTDDQKKLLKRYDEELEKKYPGAKFNKQFLWPTNDWQIKQGSWPQYYIGAFPYCYRLPEYTATAWPPPPTPSGMAGMPMDSAENHASAAPLRMGQSPGTHWYHAHKHGSTAINVANGMTGAFIIEGQYDDDLNTWYNQVELWTRTQPVMVINQLGVSPNLMRGPNAAIDKGPDFSINGQLKPVVQMRPGEVQMWRIVNSSGRAGAQFVGPPGGFEWRQLAQDGVQFIDANYQKSHNDPFLLAAGNRADLLVKAPATPCTKPQGCLYPVMVQNQVDPSDLASANQITLLTVSVSGTPVDPKSNGAKFIPTAPGFPPFLADISSAEVQGTKKILFASGGPGGLPTPAAHTIDGKKFDGEVGELVLLNTVEEWKVMNATLKISHPFHIHINPFQIVEVFDPNETMKDPKNPKKTIPRYIFDLKARKSPRQCYLNPLGNPDDWKPCVPPPLQKNLIWWDVFPIPSGTNPTDAGGKKILDPKTKQPIMVPGFFKMRSRFVDYSGYYVIHCHILAHEDRGMMTVVEVAPSKSPYSHK